MSDDEQRSAASAPIRMLRIEGVREKLQISRAGVYKAMKRGLPRPVREGRAVLWFEHEIDAYLLAKREARGS